MDDWSPVWAEVAARFELAGTASALVGERTLNALLAGVDGRPSAVLKLHPPEDAEVVAFETAALRRVAATPERGVATPAVLTTAAGESAVEVATPDGVRLARALTWVLGRTWRRTDLTERWLAALGAAVAEVDGALSGLDHPLAGRALHWNLVQAAGVRDLLGAVPDLARREVAGGVLDVFADQVASQLDGLPAQVVHNDANPANVVVEESGGPGTPGPRIGLIDFGDLCRAPRVCGLAVALAYVLADAFAVDPAADPVRAGLPLVAGYHAVSPLSAHEVALLVPLARTRLAVSVVMAAWQHAQHPDNPYLLASQDVVWPALERLSSINDHLALCRTRHAVGLEPCPRAVAVRGLLARMEVAPVFGRPIEEIGYRVLDWSGPDLPPRPQVRPDQVLIGRYLEDRAVYTTDAFATPGGERRTVHLALDLLLPAGQPVHAPLDGVVELCGDNAAPLDYGPVVVLRHEVGEVAFFTLYGHLSRAGLAALWPGRAVAAGEAFASIGDETENGGWAPHVHLQVLTDLVGMGLDVPGVAPRSERAVWASLCPDPNLLLRLPESVTA